MAISFPVPLADFIDDLEIESVVFDLADKRGTTGLGSGLVNTYQISPRLWTGSVTIGLNYTTMTRQQAALLRKLQDVSTSFYISDQSALAPAGDPDGTMLGTATPLVNSLNSNNRELTIKGLPSGYILQRGDLITIDQDHTALHEVVSSKVVANSSGVTDWIEVVPHIRPGAAIDDSIYLAPAYCKAMVLPDTVAPATHKAGGLSDAITFDFIQRLD